MMTVCALQRTGRALVRSRRALMLTIEEVQRRLHLGVRFCPVTVGLPFRANSALAPLNNPAQQLHIVLGSHVR